MIFSSYKFILFLAIVFTGYHLLNRYKHYSVSKLWLVLASFYFYAQGSMKFLPYFIATVFFNYTVGTLIVQQKSKNTKKFLFAIGLIENLALLGYFKYAGFFLENVNAVFSTGFEIKNIILPIGISFFTFQLIAFIVDCYRGNTEEYSIINYLLFITFFPQLIVGPIVHHKDITPQFENTENMKLNIDNVLLGLFIFAIGCSKKVMLADPLTSFAKTFFADVTAGSFWQAHFGVLSYTLSYYFDLSGYADMAIGLGLLFNITLPQNFNSPYKARNFQDYWRRWHITLSKFLSDYVFRTVFKKGDSSAKYYLAVMTTFLVSGFWHGSAWRFVLWGLINGVLVCAANYMTRSNKSMPWFLAWFLTFIGVVGTRILFVASSTKEAIFVIKKLVNINVFSGWSKTAILGDLIDYIAINSYPIALLLIAMGIAFFAKNTTEIVKKFQFSYKYAIITGILIILSLVQMSNVADFLYFQF